MKTIGKMLVGAMIGFFATYTLLASDFEKTMESIGLEMTVVLGGVSFFLGLLCIMNIWQIKKKATASLTGEEEDLRDEWQYKKYSDATLAGNSSLIFAISTLGIALVTKQSLALIIGALLLVITTLICNTAGLSVIKFVYPDRNLPEASDKNYAKKLLAATDEGERHVMLEGLYSAYNSTNILLIGAMGLFIIYSVGSGNSQLFAILVIAIVLVTVNTQYMFKVRSK
ncbi:MULTISPECIES: DUF3169 family protein [Sporosarcina]|uniref:DUF3169 family protein n=3 Tax=Sporosarcina newyorkensis TaxID=759851 RepID=A0A1T4YW97_9BACL|nr:MULTISPECIES: DUF3169 family protein [Sporosarcina]MBY0222880.1 DUF3169 family protein [Sporosarcina aquimarina]SKB06117.1 Protein of unknown function [Sporosarcina newyorkensis]